MRMTPDCIDPHLNMPTHLSHLHRPLLAPHLMFRLSCCHAVRAVLHKPLSRTWEGLLQPWRMRYSSSTTCRWNFKQHYSSSTRTGTRWGSMRGRRRSRLLGRQVGTVQITSC